MCVCVCGTRDVVAVVVAEAGLLFLFSSASKSTLIDDWRIRSPLPSPPPISTHLGTLPLRSPPSPRCGARTWRRRITMDTTLGRCLIADPRFHDVGTSSAVYYVVKRQSQHMHNQIHPVSVITTLWALAARTGGNRGISYLQNNSTV